MRVRLSNQTLIFTFHFHVTKIYYSHIKGANYNENVLEYVRKFLYVNM